MPRSRLAYALDCPDLATARDAVAQVAGDVGTVKIGLELFCREGPPAFALAREHGAQLFADLKLHDIPETVERAIANVAAHGADYTTVHAAGGAAMLERAVRRAETERPGLRVLAVTVLTSLDGADLAAQGIGATPAEHVVRLARLAWSAGVTGFVCSPAEVAALRAALGPGALLVTPGVRPAGAATHDQKRTATPAGAIEAGANLVVVGRPIRDAADPRAAARAIVAEIAAGLAARGSAT